LKEENTGYFGWTEKGSKIGQIVRADNKKEAVAKAKYDVRNAEFIESGLYKVEVRNYGREVVADFFVKQEVTNA